jgi:hypothetical protein
LNPFALIEVPQIITSEELLPGGKKNIFNCWRAWKSLTSPLATLLFSQTKYISRQGEVKPNRPRANAADRGSILGGQFIGLIEQRQRIKEVTM